jgi:hypothetical protein
MNPTWLTISMDIWMMSLSTQFPSSANNRLEGCHSSNYVLT